MFEGTERRRAPRQACAIPATVRFGSTSFTCRIRDLSEGGARLEVPPTADVPAQFELHIPARNTTYWAVRAWRDKQQAGVELRADRRRGPRFTPEQRAALVS